MKTGVFGVLSLCALTACGDPLDRLEKISDVQIAQTDPVRGALASPEEIARDEPVLTSLINDTAPTRVESAPVAQPRGGLLSRLRRGPAPQPSPAAAIETLAPNPLQISTESVPGQGPSVPVAIEVAAIAPEAAAPESAAPEPVVTPVVAQSSVRRRGLFAGLRRQNRNEAAPQAAQPPVVVEVATAERSVETAAPPQGAVEVASVTPEIAAPKPRATKRGGFLAGLRRTPPEDTASNAQAPIETTEVPAEEAQTESAPVLAASAAGSVAVPPKADTPKPRRGLLSRLRDRTAGQPEDSLPAPAEVQTAALNAEIPTPAARAKPKAKPARAERPKKRGGLLAGNRRSKPRKGPDALDVEYGAVLPYGTVARVCDAKSKNLGSKIEKAGAGRGYALYDSVPGATGPRTFYVTGFDDGCPRQFTAALALFGAPSLHEQLRYGRPSSQYPYSTTDKAYELVKSSICLVGKRKPCGPKIDTLERDTVFISTYERFTDNGRWADILLHSGNVLAAAIKDL